MKAPVPTKGKADKQKVVETKKQSIDAKKVLTPEEEAAKKLDEKLRQQRYIHKLSNAANI